MSRRDREKREKVFFITVHLVFILTLIFSLEESFPQGKEYPEKAITIIVGTAPGGMSDVGARLCSEGFSKRLGVPIVIKNIPGGAGSGGLVATSKAKPDGYTIAASTAGVVIQQAIFSNVPYDITKDFVPICTYGLTATTIVVNSKSPFKTIQELVDYAKKNPGKLNCGTPGRGSGSHFELEMFKDHERADIVHVPFQASTPAVSALLGNHVDILFVTLPTVRGLIKAERMRPLAISIKLKEFPDIPEFPHKSMKGWVGFLAPAKIPKNVHKKLVETFAEALKDQALVEKMGKVDIIPNCIGPDELAKVIKEDLRQYSEYAEKLGIKE